MTRGLKGCYIFCTDKETNTWFKQIIGRGPQEECQGATAISTIQVDRLSHHQKYDGLALKLLKPSEVKPYVNAVPIYDLDIAAGAFSKTQLVDEPLPIGDPGNVEEYQWVELPDSFRIKPGHFIARVVGESMNRRIANGSWCLFSKNTGGSRQGKVVLVQHRSISDPDTGGQYTVKRYESEKITSGDGDWRHSRITLKPDSTDPRYKPMVFEEENASDLKVIAEMVAVLG
jgi:hypothetical protein